MFRDMIIALVKEGQCVAAARTLDKFIMLCEKLNDIANLSPVDGAT